MSFVLLGWLLLRFVSFRLAWLCLAWFCSNILVFAVVSHTKWHWDCNRLKWNRFGCFFFAVRSFFTSKLLIVSLSSLLVTHTHERLACFSFSWKKMIQKQMNSQLQTSHFMDLFVCSRLVACVISTNRRGWQRAYCFLSIFIAFSKNAIPKHKNIETHINFKYKKMHAHIETSMLCCVDSFSSRAISLKSRKEEMQTMHTMFINSWHTHKRNATSTFYVQPHALPPLSSSLSRFECSEIDRIVIPLNSTDWTGAICFGLVFSLLSYTEI